MRQDSRHQPDMRGCICIEKGRTRTKKSVVPKGSSGEIELCAGPRICLSYAVQAHSDQPGKASQSTKRRIVYAGMPRSLPVLMLK